jgi:hypothetical protein
MKYLALLAALAASGCALQMPVPATHAVQWDSPTTQIGPGTLVSTISPPGYFTTQSINSPINSINSLPEGAATTPPVTYRP